MLRSQRILSMALIALGSPALALSQQQLSPGSVGLSAARLQGVEAAVERHVLSGEIPGAIVLVQRDGRIAYWRAAGNLSAGSSAPLPKNEIFWLASMTKPMVADSILMLRDEHQLPLSDPVSRFIPSFGEPRQVRTPKPGSPPPSSFGTGPADPNAPKPQYDEVPANRPILIRDLLTHTSGIQAIGVPNDTIPAITATDTLASWVPKLGSSVLEFEPGSHWAYSNAAGFDVLARVVEVASGEPFNQFLQHRLLDPLHMRSTGFHDLRPELMRRQQPLDARMMANPCISGGRFFCGSAGLWAPADDYARFAQMLLSGGTAPDGRRLLSRDAVRLMSSNQVGELFPGIQGISGQGAGFGFGVLVITNHRKAGVAVPDGSFGWDGVGTRRVWIIRARRWSSSC